MRDPIEREFLLTFWKVHILHHAAEHGVYGHWMLQELHRHGYSLSPSTLYPILARMARRGWLRAAEPTRSTAARVYHLTPLGHDVLSQVRGALGELSGKPGSYLAATQKRKAARRSSKKPKPRRASATHSSRP
jgi:DNA-binding PadR family transcriptional regulator